VNSCECVNKFSDPGFQSHLGYECMSSSFLFVMSYVGRGHMTDRSPVQGVLPNMPKPRKRESLHLTGLSCATQEEE
jgi:hypothetical protein